MQQMSGLEFMILFSLQIHIIEALTQKIVEKHLESKHYTDLEQQH